MTLAEWFKENTGPALEKGKEFWLDTLQPQMSKVWAYSLENPFGAIALFIIGVAILATLRLIYKVIFS